MQTEKRGYKRHRFPPQIIAHAVWRYARFNLSLREVEKLMLERGVDEVVVKIMGQSYQLANSAR